MFTDQWDGFRTERAQVLTEAHRSGIADFVTITGDWHSAFIQDIRPDFDNPEFVAHSVSSSAYSPTWNATNGPRLGEDPAATSSPAQYRR